MATESEELASTTNNTQEDKIQCLPQTEESKSKSKSGDIHLVDDESSSSLSMEEDHKQTLNELELLQKFQSMYDMYVAKAAEEEHKKKENLKVGSLVDIYSTSRNEWLPGTLTQIKGDTVCILYHRKIKWLHKNSKNYRAHVKVTRTPVLQPRLLLSPSKSAPTEHQIDLAVVKENDNAMSASYSSLSQSRTPMTPMSPMTHAKSPISMSFPLTSQKDIHLASLQHKRTSNSTQQKRNILSQNTYEYDVTFRSTKLGISLCSLQDSMNCMVKKCNSEFAKKSVNCGSIIYAINGTKVYGLSHKEICAIIKAKIMKPPLVITFRSKISGNNFTQINNINERGLLQIKVVCGIELKHAAKYVAIKVGRACLTTKELKKSNHHPEWNEVLLFKNFRCDRGKKAYVTVYDSSFVSKDKTNGTCEFELPIKFNSVVQNSLEIKDAKGKTAGAIMVNTIVTK